jgi:hypothetical protein
MVVVGKPALGEPGFDGVIKVQAGNLVAVRGEDHRDEPASGCDFEVDPRLKQDGVLEQ